MGGAEIYPSRSHYDLDDDVGRVEQNEEVNSSRDYDQLMKQDRIKRALPSVEQEGGRPSQIGTRPSRFLMHLNLCGFAVVTLENSTEFRLATNLTFRIRNKGCIQDGVVSTDTAMGPLLMIMFEPHADYIVKLSSAEADEMIQHFAFRTTNEALYEGVCFGCPRRYTNASDFGFPELVEFARIFSVSISDDKARTDALFIHPHRYVSCLLHYPFGIRMIGAWATVDLSATQMNEHKDVGIANSCE